MKYLILSICLLVTIFEGLCAEGGEEMVEVKTAKNGVELSARIPKKCVAGHAIEVVISLVNRSKNKVIYSHVHKWGDFGVMVKDDKGKPVPLTKFGYFRIGGEREEYARKTKRLTPGKSHSVSINLARLFDLTFAGTYELSLERPINDIGASTKKRFYLKIVGHKFTVLHPPYFHKQAVNQPNRRDKIPRHQTNQSGEKQVVEPQVQEQPKGNLNNKPVPEEKEPAVKEKPKPIEQPKPVVEPVQVQSEPSREWLVLCVIVAGVVIAGLVLFFLLRRGKRSRQ